MNVKTKAIGLLAGSALALSLASGAMADTDGTNANAELTTNGDGVCSIAFDEVEETKVELSFGTYEWDGSSYTFVADSAVSAPATVTQDISNQSESCFVSVAMDGDLELDGESATDVIASSDITLQINGGADTDVEIATGTGGAAATVSGSINASAVTTSLATGSYTGTLTITSAESAG